MLEDTLILVTGSTLVIFGLQAFMTPYRRKFANEMIKAATLMIMGLFLLYYWQVNVSLGTSGNTYRN
jgi:hypothetical protein